MRFLRFLRNDLSVKTSDGSRWPEQAKDAHGQSKSSNRLPSSAPLNRITELFDKPFPTMGRTTLVCRGSCMPPPESESRVHHSCARSVIRARRSQCGVPQLALRAITQLTLCRIEVAPVPGLSNVATPTKAIITIPITLYRYGNGDDAEGGSRRMCNGREHREYKRDKARRCSRLVRSLGDRKRDMLRLHPAAASLSPRAPDPRPACPGPSTRAGALAMNAAPGTLPRQHFLHYFCEEALTGERGIRTSENTPSPHSGE
jgi:hypothetical protein